MKILKNHSKILLVVYLLFSFLATIFLPLTTATVHAQTETVDRRLIVDWTDTVGPNSAYVLLDSLTPGQVTILETRMELRLTYDDIGPFSSSFNLRSIARDVNIAIPAQGESFRGYDGELALSFASVPEDRGILRERIDVFIGGRQIVQLDFVGASLYELNSGELRTITEYLQNLSENQVQSIIDGEDVTGGVGDLGDEDEQAGGCESNAINIPFSLLLCPIVEGMFQAIEGLYSRFILPQLNVSPLDSSPDAPDDTRALYSVWNSFRVIANILFVGIFLLAIIGQAFSWIFTPYELKKIIPRLAIGVIAAQLSWFIAGFLVDVFNVLGGGVRALMLAPLDGLDSNANFNFDLLRGVLAGVVSGVGTGIVLFVIGIGGILWGMPLILAPIILALLATFVTVMLRKILIFLLIIIAPIAFILWILPGTEKFFKAWWGYFWKALFAYPVIIALISGGEFMGRVITATEGEGNSPSVSQSIVGLIAVFAPYFFIPAAFRLAGGALAGISGNLDSMGKNASNRLFGESYDPNSHRGKRLERIRSKRSTRAVNLASGNIRAVPFSNLGVIAKRFPKLSQKRISLHSSGDGKVSQRWNKFMDRAIAEAMPDIIEQEAELFRKEYEEVRNTVSNGPDDRYYAGLANDDPERWNSLLLAAGMGVTEDDLASGNHPFKESDISPQDLAVARSFWEDNFGNKRKAAAALTYLISKTNQTDQIGRVMTGFLGNEGLGFSKTERKGIVAQAVDDPSVQQSLLALKHTDWDTGKIARGEEYDFISQLTGEGFGGPRIGDQKPFTWNQTDKVLDDVLERNVYRQNGIDPGNIGAASDMQRASAERQMGDIRSAQLGLNSKTPSEQRAAMQTLQSNIDTSKWDPEDLKIAKKAKTLYGSQGFRESGGPQGVGAAFEGDAARRATLGKQVGWLESQDWN